MLVGAFKDARLAVLILIPFTTAIVWIPSFYNEAQVQLHQNPMPFYKVVLLLFQLPHWLLNIFAIILISVQAIYLNVIINNYEVLYKHTNLTALFYPLIISFIPQLLWLHPIIFANLILIFTLGKIFSTYKHTNPLSRFFDIGFLIAGASMFYFPAIFLIILVFASLAIVRPFVWREWIASIIGLLLPYFFISVYYFWFDKLAHFWMEVIPSQIPRVFLVRSFYTYINTAVVAATVAFLVLALLKLRSNFSKNAIRTRDYLKIIISYLVLSVMIYILTEDTYRYSIAITAIPATVLMAYYFLTLRKKWIYEGLFFIWLLAITFSLIEIA